MALCEGLFVLILLLDEIKTNKLPALAFQKRSFKHGKNI